MLVMTLAAGQYEEVSQGRGLDAIGQRNTNCLPKNHEGTAETIIPEPPFPEPGEEQRSACLKNNIIPSPDLPPRTSPPSPATIKPPNRTHQPRCLQSAPAAQSSHQRKKTSE